LPGYRFLAGGHVDVLGLALGGRPLVLRYGKYFFISPEKIEGAERWAAHYGAFGIFASRLLPVVRHLIVFPRDCADELLAILVLHPDRLGLWCAVLCWLGVKSRRHQQR